MFYVVLGIVILFCFVFDEFDFFVVAAPRAVKMAPITVRFMGTAAPSGDVVIPELHDTLEWVLSSPPNVHQFEEPPVSILLILIRQFSLLTKFV